MLFDGMCGRLARRYSWHAILLLCRASLERSIELRSHATLNAIAATCCRMRVYRVASSPPFSRLSERPQVQLAMWRCAYRGYPAHHRFSLFLAAAAEERRFAAGMDHGD